MRLSMAFRIGLLLFALVAVMAVLWQFRPVTPETETDIGSRYSVNKTLKYGFQVTNPTNEYLEGVEFWAYAPVSRTEHQYVKALSSNVQMHVELDRVGNQRVFFSVRGLPPYGKKRVELTARLAMSDSPVPIERGVTPDHYLGEQPFMEINQPAIQQLSTTLDLGDDRAIQAFHWVKDQIRNPGYVAQDRGALAALQSREGDCSGHMYLLVSLLRAMKLPARGVAGFVLPDNAKVSASQLHNWSEFHDGDKWVGMDSDRGVMPVPATEYVALRILDQDSPFFGDGSQAMFGGAERVQITMD